MSAKLPKPISFVERRRAPRFPLRQGITVKWPDPGLPSWGGDPEFLVQPATCRDLSTTGIYLWVQRPPASGAELEILMEAPPEMLPGQSVFLACRGRVLRVESDLHFERTGVAVVFDRIETTKSAA